MSTSRSSLGKIGPGDFNRMVLPRLGRQRDDVRRGPAFGVDTAVIDLGSGQGLAVSSDPLSLIPTLGLQESAWLSVHLLVNDMATTGFSPMYAQFVLNLPPDLARDDFESYWDHIHRYCDGCGVAVTGGHTGQIEGQNSTISGGGTMFLTAPIDQIITSDGAEPGDVIVVTKESALNATSILAMSFPETVSNRLGREVLDTARENFFRTSSLNDGLTAADLLQPRSELRAMHDVTEGGVLGAIQEMAKASGCGFRVESDQIPTGHAQVQIARLFGIDHRLCVGAGSMIMAVRSGLEERLITGLRSEGIPAAAVGRMTPEEQGYLLVEEGVEHPFSFDGTDPYWHAFFKALNLGWR